MCITSGKMKLSETDLESADPVAYDTLEKWEKNGRNTDMLNEILYDSEKSASVTHRYITLLEEVLKHFKGTLKEDYSKKHKEVFGSIDCTDRIKSDLATFSVLYESVLNESDTNTRHDINPVDEVLETTLYDIHTKILKGTAHNEGKHVCPCCGTVINGNAAKNDILVRCPSCRVRFRSNNAEWTPTSVQRKINRKRNEEEERFNSLVRSEVESRLETERKAAVAQTKKDIQKSMPGWLRWLTEDYFE
jgi:rubrerythrin